MKLEELTTIDQLSQLLNGTQAAVFKINTVKAESKNAYVVRKVLGTTIDKDGQADL